MTPSEPFAVRPLTRRVANRFIAQFHRHHKPVVGDKFRLGAFDGHELVGVAIVGRPVARRLDNGVTMEVTRLCVKQRNRGIPSLLYNAAAAEARTRGASRVVTYTLAEEPAKSLQWARWRKAATSAGGSWSSRGRRRYDRHPLGPKVRWEAPL